jgi:hypothetical protein
LYRLFNSFIQLFGELFPSRFENNNILLVGDTLTDIKLGQNDVLLGDKEQDMEVSRIRSVQKHRALFVFIQ